MIILKWLFVIYFSVSVTVIVYYTAWIVEEWRRMEE